MLGVWDKGSLVLPLVITDSAYLGGGGGDQEGRGLTVLTDPFGAKVPRVLADTDSVPCRSCWFLAVLGRNEDRLQWVPRWVCFRNNHALNIELCFCFLVPLFACLFFKKKRRRKALP